MKPHGRLRNLLRAAAYERALRSVERSIARRALLQREEFQRLEGLRRQYFPDPSQIPNKAPYKYLQFERRLGQNLRRAQRLGLLEECRPRQSRRVLDIGCG